MRSVTALFLCTYAAWAQPWAITHVTVIDVEAGRAVPDMTVVVDGERIVSVGPAKKARVPLGAQIVDGRGKYLIPGLWDMHVHMMSSQPPDPNDPAPAEFYAPQFLANGITGVRSMFDNLGAMRKLTAPRVVASGPILDGPNAYWAGSIPCANTDQARAAVRRLKAEGVGFLKVYSGLGKEAYFAIAEEARRVGLSFAGHMPNSITAAEASDAGQESLEHLTGLDNDKPELWAKFVKNGTWVTPTLTVLRSTAYYT
ncbi:MAG TPA: amidohydrolase family protein, partial [Bryobacteraceae bacterium]|nr:amidohydrolase family protein [Bryobacteraceae bacterium]